MADSAKGPQTPGGGDKQQTQLTDAQKAEIRRKYWIKESVESRRKYCLNKAVDLDAVNAASNGSILPHS